MAKKNKICPSGIAWAKRTFDKYPSAYANMAARKSFKARHKCSTAKDKLTARYWSCKKLWAGKGGSTKSSPKSKRGKY